uniref:Uncharacterized protein n=1 Tax=Anguilla anguilla TaxID=7936 RepID=A0A0E9U6D9_ANGAN
MPPGGHLLTALIFKLAKRVVARDRNEI